MSLSNRIQSLRTAENLSQSQFAEVFHVSQQAVQKWESGAAVPDLEKLVKIAQHFHLSLDQLVLGAESRKPLQPRYDSMQSWQFYASDLMTEYKQALDEGLDVESLKPLFEEASKMPCGEAKKKMGDAIFELVCSAPMRKDYPYVEPSDLEEIRALRKPYEIQGQVPGADVLREKLHGAWSGRVCGCLLGKTVEGIRWKELDSLLKETNNFPMHRYILSTDITEEMMGRYQFQLKDRAYADKQPYMPFDDDTNYLVLAQEVIAQYGRDFTPFDMSRAWLHHQPKDVYCTAEQVAYCNFVKGYEPPDSAAFQNPYREWIGAQIRGDYFGYINPGNPEMAAEMAFRDASISHVKNGIYGEMFIAAMLACAAVTDDREAIIRGGLAQVPSTSRLYESVMGILDGYRSGVSREDAYRSIRSQYDECTSYGWCHTISNAMIVTMSLLYGEGDYSKSICMAVTCAFDTDCNGATVGSILGMALGFDKVGSQWVDPIRDTLQTTLVGMSLVSIPERVEMTLKHLG